MCIAVMEVVAAFTERLGSSIVGTVSYKYDAQAGITTITFQRDKELNDKR